MSCISRARIVFAAVTWLTAVTGIPAHAVDGVLEINQVCAVNSGCFPGDMPAFPVQITQPGSYRLTGNLITDLGLVNVIDINTDDVTLDLGGFLIDRVSPSGHGIVINGNNVAILNGTIRGQNHGIRIASGDNNRVIDVRLIGNEGGIAVRAQIPRIEGCTIDSNSVWGIQIGSDLGVVIRENVIKGNGIDFNLGGNTSIVELGPNFCGTDLNCP